MSNPSRVLVSGPLSVFVSGFREGLLLQGYTPGAAAKQLQLMAHVSRWMAAQDLEPGGLHGVEIERFVQERRASHAQLASAHALWPLLGYLRGLGVVPPAGSKEACTSAGALLDRYAEYLLVTRGLNPSTVRNYCNHARAFLTDREWIAGDLALAALDVAAINRRPPRAALDRGPGHLKRLPLLSYPAPRCRRRTAPPCRKSAALNTRPSS